MRLLEVVPDDLISLDELLRREPVGEALVELGPHCLGERLVRRVPDEQVAEPEALVLREGGRRRTDELLPYQRRKVRLDGGTDRIRSKNGDGATMEDLALDGSALHDDAHVPVERVDPRLQERVDRRRNSDLAVSAVLADHRQHLLDVERVARRGRRDAFAQVARERGIGDEPVHQLRAFARRERFQEQRRRVQLAAAPVRPGIQQLGARDAQKEDRSVAREVGQMLDEVDEDGLGPLQVVDHDDLRPIGCTGFEEAPKRELGLGRGRADDRVRLDADRDQRFYERPVGDALAVREAASTQDVSRVSHAFEEVGDEA